jgi:hypothetical protein
MLDFSTGKRPASAAVLLLAMSPSRSHAGPLPVASLALCGTALPKLVLIRLPDRCRSQMQNLSLPASHSPHIALVFCRASLQDFNLMPIPTVQ